MKAELLPLIKEDYGSKVKITDDSGYEYTVKFWNDGSYEPSNRELNGICTIQQWRDNEILVINYQDINAKDVVDIRGNHFESRETYIMLKKLVEMINSSGDTTIVTGINHEMPVAVGKTKGVIFGSGC